MPSQAKYKSAVEVKVQQHAMPARRVKMYLISWRNRFKPGELSLARDKILQRDWTELNSAAGHGLYMQFTRPFPFFAEVGLAWETNIVAYHAAIQNVADFLTSYSFDKLSRFPSYLKLVLLPQLESGSQVCFLCSRKSFARLTALGKSYVYHPLAPLLPALPAGDVSGKVWPTPITQQVRIYPKILLGFASWALPGQ